MKIKVDVITPFFYGNEYIYFLVGVLEENACEMQSAFPGTELCWHIMNDSLGCSVKLKKENGSKKNAGLCHSACTIRHLSGRSGGSS
ncbi:MAG: hypothetical protein LKG80_08090 [Lachnospiraceae bacterium]|jgi:hypothetical protein|nr:hypothetical protein [Lachnospiraceae bacterium]MCH4030053.1 hypothetical protein [Lachnospiraceae bacterium]MCH4070287.1 hypothetical protein [Lachnospiraceae bacterium]MCH4107799.1 hypothetical protein [Lachnospiraceae bacterium]MCI1361504.1 hypothetical protein [Lachnospiraceae bacterium]